MPIQDHLTNEQISKKFKSQFDLVNYAIKLTENYIKVGQEAHSHFLENPVLKILYDIEHGKDKFHEIAHVENNAEKNHLSSENSLKKMKNMEFETPKKNKKILTEV